jgi:hypothetical protein
VNDLSKGDAGSRQFGGYFSPHSSHQNGLDVDIRYIRNDGSEAPLNIAGPDSIYYDPDATVSVMNCLIANANVSMIFIDSVHAGLSGSILHNLAGHSDHFHVRIFDPDGDNKRLSLSKAIEGGK